MLSRRAGRAQDLAAAGKFETTSPSSLCFPTSPQPTGHQSSRKGGRTRAQPHPTHPPAREAFPQLLPDTPHLPFSPGKCTGITAHAQAWGNGSPAQSPQEVYCCHHQQARSFSQTSSHEAEARVTLLPVRSQLGVSSSHCHLEPSPASTSTAPSTLLQEEELKLLFAVAGTQAAQQQTPPMQCYRAPAWQASPAATFTGAWHTLSWLIIPCKSL